MAYYLPPPLRPECATCTDTFCPCTAEANGRSRVQIREWRRTELLTYLRRQDLDLDENSGAPAQALVHCPDNRKLYFSYAVFNALKWRPQGSPNDAWTEISREDFVELVTGWPPRDTKSKAGERIQFGRHAGSKVTFIHAKDPTYFVHLLAARKEPLKPAALHRRVQELLTQAPLSELPEVYESEPVPLPAATPPPPATATTGELFPNVRLIAGYSTVDGVRVQHGTPTPPEQYTMRIGRLAGKRICDVMPQERSYLEWLTKWEKLWPNVREAIQAGLAVYPEEA